MNVETKSSEIDTSVQYVQALEYKNLANMEQQHQ